LVSFLGVPLVLEDIVVGILTVATREPRHFTDDEVTLTEALARSAAVAIWNARLYEETQERLAQTETLLNVSQAVTSTLNGAEVARRTARELVRALGADIAAAWMLNAEGDGLVPLAGYHIPRDLLVDVSAARLAAESSLVAMVTTAGAPVFSNDSPNDPRFDHPIMRLIPHKSVILLPMRVKKQIIGGFAVLWTRERHEVRVEEVRLVESMVQQAAIAIENARLFDAEREARARLAVSETQYRELLENVIDMVYLHDLDGRVLAINEAGVRVTGYARNELLGMKMVEMVVPADRERGIAFAKALIAGQPPAEPFVGEFMGKGGRRFILECAERLVLKDGVPVAILGSARDITERRKLEHRQAVFVEIVKELAAEDDFERLFALIGHRVCELMETDGAIMFLVEGELLARRATYGVPAPERVAHYRKIRESRVRRVLEAKRPFATPDLLLDPLWKDSVLATQISVRAMLEVPIMLRGEAIGVLTVLERQPRRFTEEDQGLLVALAEHTAVALDRTDLLKKLERRLVETETLLSVSQAAGSTLNIAEVARRTIREMVRALGADMGGAWRRDPDGDGYLPVAGYHVPPELLTAFGQVSLSGNGGLIQRLRNLQEIVFSEDSQNDPAFDDPLARLVPHQSVLVVPMAVKDAVIGGFAVIWARAQHRLTPDQLRLVEGIAAQAAIAIENARLLEAEREARHHLAVSETRYRELFDNVIDIVYLHDLEGRLLAINDAGVRMSGYTREEVLGMNVVDFLSPEDVERSLEAVRRMARGDRPLESFTARFVGKDGRRSILECVGRMVYREGVPVAVLGSARDITERRRLEERQAALVALGQEFATEVRLDLLLPRIAEEARRLMGTDAGALMLIEGQELVFRGLASADPALTETAFDLRTSRTGRALLRGKAIILPDISADPEWHDSRALSLGYRAMLSVPIMLKENPLGVLRVLHRQPRAFSETDTEFLRALANHAALAIDNARLFAAQREEADVSAGLLRLAGAVEGVQDLDEVLEIIVRATPSLLGTAQCLLFLFNANDSALVPSAAFGLTETARRGFLEFREALAVPSMLRAAQSQEPQVIEVGTPDFDAARPLVDLLDAHALLVLPLASGGRFMGVMATHTPGRPHRFTGKEIALARGAAAHAAVAIDKARLFQQTQVRLRETETLLSVSQELIGTLDPMETMRRVSREICRALGADMVGAYLGAPDDRDLTPIAGYHVPPEMVEHFVRHPIPIVGNRALEDAWQHRHTVWSSDVETDPRMDHVTWKRFPHRSSMFVPMYGRGKPMGGFFIVWWQARHRFTPDELRLVEGISDQAAIYMENARLYSEATQRRREAEELARLARMLTASLEAGDVGERTVAAARTLLGATGAALRVRLPDGSLKLVATIGQDITTVDVLPAGVGVAGRAVAVEAPVWSGDVLDDPQITFTEEVRHSLASEAPRAVLAVPLKMKEQTIGALVVARPEPRTFSDVEIGLLQTFADQAAIALENSRLYGELRTALKAVEDSQQRIVQGERLRALGEMAGGVAHDFNNTLAIIVGRAEVLLTATADVELHRQLDVIVKVALDAAQTVKRIQEFTRMRRARPFQRVDIKQLADEVVEVTRSRWKDQAQARDVKYDVVVEAAPTPTIAGDPSEIREALTNIVFNALDAMPDGGRLTLRTGVAAGNRVFCSVADTGVGMSDDVKQRIFDPFFTTKGERGTGLGLSVVYGIVTRHGGDLEVESRLGAGTTFTMRLPVGGDAAETTAAAAPKAAPARAIRILVIDDEAEVTDVIRDLLARDGHTIEASTDGEEGVQRLRQEPFDLVFTDLGMPKLSGWEVARLVKSLRPGTPVAMVTGWGDRIDPGEARARGVEYVICKPFTRDDIRSVVAATAAALGGAARPAAARVIKRVARKK
ncbi:MAG: GAF domain-containing protein, partial [Candidatus Rokubacteria bacterium]|nr:GAF domain-containing protein [Candidatus Rokubacteria bacterium]